MEKKINISGILSKAALLLLALLVLMMLTGCSDDDDWDWDTDEDTGPETYTDTDTQPTQGTALVDRPGGRDLAFEPIEPSFSSDTPDIKMIEINQSLSYGFDTDTGQMYRMENFVAGKETAIFIDLAQPFDQKSIATLTIECGGRVIAELMPSHIHDSNTLLFLPKNMSDVENWPEGAYTFTFEMPGGRAVRTVNFFNSIPMTILAVPVLANYSGEVYRCEGDWREGAAMLVATYPVAKAEVNYILAPELDLSDDKYDLDTDKGQFNVWQALSNLQTRNNDYTLIVGYIRYPADDGTLLGYTYGAPTSIVVESEPDMLATVVHEIAHCYNIGDEYSGGHLNLIQNSPPYRMEGIDIMTSEPTIATKELVIGGNAYGISGTGSVIYEQQRAYWVEGRTPLGAVTSYMGSGTGADSFTMWTTSDIWNHLFNTFIGHSTSSGDGGIDINDDIFPGNNEAGAGGNQGSNPGGNQGSGTNNDSGDYWGQCPDCFRDVCSPDLYVECWECSNLTWGNDCDIECNSCGIDLSDCSEEDIYLECTACDLLIFYPWFNDHNSGQGRTGKTAQPVYVVEITGYIDAGGSFNPSPWYTYETDPSQLTSSRAGSHSVNIYDRSGNLLSATPFSVAQHGKVVTSDGPALVPVGHTPVNVIARFPDNAAKITILAGDREIFTRNVSNNAPEVAFTGLTDYQQLSDEVTLTWNASDADGDELFFEIWYCPAEDDFYNVAADITGQSITLDMSSYPGTNEGYFYIYATDGILTAEIDSPWIKVPYKAPEIISEITDIPDYKITAEIILDADIYDLQDGWLWDSDEVVWTLDGREFMTGSFLWVWPYELPPGTHTFTCTATNSAGMSTQKDFTFRIIDDESDLPDDWSKYDIVNALSNGFVTPLDRIDAPITRGQFASLMTTLFSYVSDEDDPFPDYEENVVTDCGQDDYDQFFMVSLGVMEAPGGRFEPNKPLTERDAALIMYKTVALADPELLDISETERNILELFEDVEVFEEPRENAYSASKDLTNRLALVRVSRLFDAIFE